MTKTDTRASATREGTDPCGFGHSRLVPFVDADYTWNATGRAGRSVCCGRSDSHWDREEYNFQSPVSHQTHPRFSALDGCVRRCILTSTRPASTIARFAERVSGSVVDSDLETNSIRDPVTAAVNPRARFISLGF